MGLGRADGHRPVRQGHGPELQAHRQAGRIHPRAAEPAGQTVPQGLRERRAHAAGGVHRLPRPRRGAQPRGGQGLRPAGPAVDRRDPPGSARRQHAVAAHPQRGPAQDARPGPPAAAPAARFLRTKHGPLGRGAGRPRHLGLPDRNRPMNVTRIEDTLGIYLKNFIARYNLDEGQQQTAKSILRESREEATGYRESHKQEFAELEANKRSWRPAIPRGRRT